MGSHFNNMIRFRKHKEESCCRYPILNGRRTMKVNPISDNEWKMNDESEPKYRSVKHKPDNRIFHQDFTGRAFFSIYN